MPAQPRHHAAQETWSTDVLILHPGRGLDALRRLHGHGRAISLTTIFDEHYPMLCDMALRANKRMPLNATDSSRLVRDHVRQGSIQHRRLYNASHAPERTRIERPPASGSIGPWPSYGAVTRYVVD